MGEKLKFFKVTAFAADDQVLTGTLYVISRQVELLLPVSAISYLVQTEPGNSHSFYSVHFNIISISKPPFRIK